IGIAIKDLNKAVSTYQSLLNTDCYKRETVDAQQVETAFLKAGDTKIELLAATSSNSVIKKFIAKRGEGMHHVAFEVDDLGAEIKRIYKIYLLLLSESN